jgi:hypothetical protein
MSKRAQQFQISTVIILIIYKSINDIKIIKYSQMIQKKIAVPTMKTEDIYQIN